MEPSQQLHGRTQPTSAQHACGRGIYTRRHAGRTATQLRRQHLRNREQSAPAITGTAGMHPSWRSQRHRRQITQQTGGARVADGATAALGAWASRGTDSCDWSRARCGCASAAYRSHPSPMLAQPTVSQIGQAVCAPFRCVVVSLREEFMTARLGIKRRSAANAHSDLADVFLHPNLPQKLQQ
jgi:hypothetical protein